MYCKKILLFVFVFLCSFFITSFSYAYALPADTVSDCSTTLKLDDILQYVEDNSIYGSYLDGTRYVTVYQSSFENVTVNISNVKTEKNRQLYFTYESPSRKLFGYEQTTDTYRSYWVKLKVNFSTGSIISINSQSYVNSGNSYVMAGNDPYCWYGISDDFPKDTYSPQYSPSNIYGGYSQYWFDNGGTFITTFSERRAIETPPDSCPNIAGIQDAVPDGFELDDDGNCVVVSSGGGLSIPQLQQLYGQLAGISLALFISFLLIRQFRWKGTD